MSERNVKSLAKKLTAGVLATGMIVTGMIVIPKTADAEDTVTIPTTVIYDETYQIADYWNNGKKAPVKEGYVFGGWFKEDADSTANNKETLQSENGNESKICVPLTTTDIDSDTDEMVDDGVKGIAIAKFVPAQVLSVKAQNGVDEGKEEITSADKISKENPMWIRVITSLDTKNYDKIGFDIYLANKKQPKNKDGGTLLETTKVYRSMIVKGEAVTANTIFGGVSQYACVWKLDKIDTASNANKIIYVRPYWYTMDGTKVEGLAKYVHIEDDYMGYVNIPINLLNKEAVAQIAAGSVHVTYTGEGGNEVGLKFKEVEAGRILPEMVSRQDGNTIKMVGNIKTAASYNPKETIYANIRFQKPEDVSDDVNVDFAINMVEFCDWNENSVAIEEKWDIQYVK